LRKIGRRRGLMWKLMGTSRPLWPQDAGVKRFILEDLDFAPQCETAEVVLD
jgi:hypothetical protein